MSKPGVFQRRLSRSGLACRLLAGTVLFFLASLGFVEAKNPDSALLQLVWVATLLCISVWMFICAVERLNDINRPRWFVLFLLIPYVNLAIWLWLLFSKSRQETCEGQNGNPTASGVS